ncbi:metal-dependent hydrolase [Mesonia aestuariivivens]|uniref:Metal-dependent hydrolase n=1 Tax=Mesonia aestuariivivens TaxID=2796128 RepID=A0ABS6W3X1_9FLAO|nr:metal-dependent hydrolase [Mesonia aestuariivivens]MBW2962560.1 metal-dependent hydrolase [Mesonia aestuariivivens]
MDSLTQIVLGAAVGEAVLGKKVGNKAMLYGAIAGTIPDLDTFASYFVDTVTALEIHRGFTHSILFSIVFAPIFGWLVSLWETKANWKAWAWLFFWGFLTHPLLDAHTTWGTQLFWPLDLRLAYKNIFVIDPLYTLPFLVFVILAMRQKRGSAQRRKLNNLGLIVSSAYMMITLMFKWITYQKFEDALQQQHISYIEMETKPSPFNTILWTANVDTESAYLIGHYSLFDSQPIQFTAYPKHHEWLGDFKHKEKVQRLINITKGWYTISKENDKLYLNDLRFGLLGFSPSAKNFAFSFQLQKQNGNVIITEKEKDTEQAKKLVEELWSRLKGN